jgi:hypothetical protein
MERGLFRAANNTTVTDTAVLTGSGSYEGLSAYLAFNFDGSPPVDVSGAIFPGGLPPVVTFEDLPEE